MVVVAAVSKPRELSSDVMAAFIHQVSIESPSEEQRWAMLASLSGSLPLGRDVNLARLAKHTAVRSIAWVLPLYSYFIDTSPILILPNISVHLFTSPFKDLKGTRLV